MISASQAFWREFILVMGNPFGGKKVFLSITLSCP